MTPAPRSQSDRAENRTPPAGGKSAFLDPSQYRFTEVLQRNAPLIREELGRVLAVNRFEPYPEPELYDGAWDVFGFYWFGEKIPGNCARCPHTAGVIEQVPNLVTAGYSRLAAGAVIKAHVGFTSEVLRCHLGLITPASCAIRVGGEIRHWRENECLIFDDTVEHEAWNRSGTDRVVLLLDFLKSPAPASSAAPRPPAHVPGPRSIKTRR